MKKNLLFIQFYALTVMLVTACSNRYERAVASPYRDGAITQSLFEYKDRSISEADIQRILDGKIEPPDTVRVAVYKFFDNIARRYSYLGEDETRFRLEQQMYDTLIGEIQRSARVQKVIVMPIMVTGYSPNINQLREAAVRLQTDMLLIYSIKSDLYYQYRALKKDDAKAYATCEAVLMDIRTGVIPHSSVTTREAYGKKSPTDLNMDEWRHRIQNTAITAAMLETGKSAARYLGKLR